MSRELSPDEKLAAGRLMACETLPYFASALHALTPLLVPEGSLDTYGVTKNSILLVDHSATSRWPVATVSGVLVHEALHIIRDHANRAEAFGIESFGEGRIWNIAADLEINDDMDDMRLKLPEGAVTPSMFGLKEGLTAELYYAELKKRANQCPKCGGISISMPGTGNQQDQDQDQDGNESDSSSGKKGKSKKAKGSKGKQSSRKKRKGGKNTSPDCPMCSGPESPQAGAGWCGSGAGAPVPGEPDNQGQGKTDDGGRSQVELNSLRRRVAEAVQDYAAKSRGSVPGGLLRWADATLAPPRIDWRTKLAQVARAAIAFRPGAVDFKYHRPSRRQGGLGYGLGCPRLPALIQPVPRVAITIDTSGSMSRDDLRVGVEESAGILTAVGADVDFIACDASVGTIRKVRSARELAESLVGGGGTDFAPAFEAAEKLRPRPEILVYVTDGCGPAPAKPPIGIRTIWLIVGRHAETPWFQGEPFGEIIKVDDIGDGAAAA